MNQDIDLSHVSKAQLVKDAQQYVRCQAEISTYCVGFDYEK